MFTKFDVQKFQKQNGFQKQEGISFAFFYRVVGQFLTFIFWKINDYSKKCAPFQKLQKLFKITFFFK